MKSSGLAQHKMEGSGSKGIFEWITGCNSGCCHSYFHPLGSWTSESWLWEKLHGVLDTSSDHPQPPEVLPQPYKSLPPAWICNYICKRPVYRPGLPAALDWQKCGTTSEFNEPRSIASLLWLWSEFLVEATLCGTLWGRGSNSSCPRTAIPAEVLHTWKVICSQNVCSDKNKALALYSANDPVYLNCHQVTSWLPWGIISEFAAGKLAAQRWL